LANGVLASRAQVETSDIHFHSNGPVKLVTQRIELQPAGSSGLHMHPGLVLATVTVGAVTFHGSACDTEAYSAGQSFVEPAFSPLMVTNDSGSVADFIVTYMVPAGSVVRIDAPAPDCAS
jgi:quercetin dioxygenase-like cupin family protein